ncbi:MAG UNVERIFIED_CONTAM: UDP-N-acetylmuramoyl-L-alanine--D-glutamate ligase [Planctomycetaceae bacterium]|jgi:UDP-N-acetylmuramoylalanine--D-glutamate ligase
MIKLAKEKNKLIGIFGLARTGEALYLALKDIAENVICYDDSKITREAFASKYGPKALIPITDPIWRRLDKIILSPGIPLYGPNMHPIVNFAEENNIAITSDIDLLYEAREDAAYIAITGTNGKSTTTSLIHHILKMDNAKWDIGGNIGSSVMNMDHEANGYVLEVSSYQIDLLKTFRANIGILLNITPDHLERHGTMEKYIEVKKSLLARSDIRIVGGDGIESTKNVIAREAERSTMEMSFLCGPESRNCNSNELQKLYNWIPDQVRDDINISTKKIAKDTICVKDGKIYDYIGPELKEYILPDNKSLMGEHNRENIAASFAACRIVGMTPEIILKQIASFVGLPHRMQFLGTKYDIDFYNDSKATNADAAARSIGLLHNIYLLLGGVPKEGGIKDLLHLNSHITKAYIFGQAKSLFAEQLEGLIAYEICDNIDEATKKAVSDARSSKAKANILLAPACASFDQFKDFEERGYHFIELYDRM